MKKSYEILIYIFLLVMFIIGGVLGVYLIGKEEGVFDFGLVVPIIGGTVVGLTVSFLFTKWRKKRKGNVPEVDERSVLLMKRYFLAVLYVVLFGSGALLIVLYGIGVHTIDTGMIAVYMAILYLLIGVGAFVVKRFC